MKNATVLDKISTWAERKDKQYQRRQPTEKEIHKLKYYPLWYNKLAYFVYGLGTGAIGIALIITWNMKNN